MTMTSHERDHAHDADHDDANRDPAASPGRASRTGQLAGPGGPRVSSLLMRKAARDAELAGDAEHAVAQASGSGGEALPAELRDRFEGSLGADLASVRIHTGAESQSAAAAVSARAYTVGNDIHFAAGQYDPSSTGGQQLLAHEVAHTVQQRGGSPVRQHKLEVSQSDDPLELEADRAAESMVSGAPIAITGGDVAIARKASGQPRPLTADDKARLANAKQLLTKAKANVDKVTKALEGYSQEAPNLLAEIQATFDETLKIYKSQYTRVNDVIKRAKDIYQLQLSVLTAIVDQLSGPIMGKLGEIMTKTTAAYNALQVGEKALIDSMRSANALDALKKFQSDVSEKTGGATDKPIDAGKDAAKKQAGLDTEGEGPTDGSEGMELAFYKSFSALKGKANQLLPAALGVAKLGTPFGEASTLVDVMTQDNKTRPDKSPQDVETDAAHVWNGSTSLGVATPSVTAALAGLRSAAQQGKASKPKNELEIQKDLWVKWAAGLSPDNTDMLDLGGIEDHLRAIGIWDQLGIDVGDWFSDKEEALAVCSAKAQAMVLEHKGEVVEVANDYSGYTKVRIAAYGLLPGRFEGSPHGKQVRATIVGARTIGPLDDSLLAPKDKQAIAERLLRDGLVEVVVRPFETVEDPADAAAFVGPPAPAADEDRGD